MTAAVMVHPWAQQKVDRRHYKKDSRFVLDLYTLTYDSHESLDSLGDLNAVSLFLAPVEYLLDQISYIVKKNYTYSRMLNKYVIIKIFRPWYCLCYAPQKLITQLELLYGVCRYYIIIFIFSSSH